MAGLAGVAAWQAVGMLIGAVYFRERPFIAATIDLKEILFHRPTYSFPSDHALCFAAIVGIFWFYGYKKLASFILFVGLANGLTRVAVGMHYPFDILAGWILGFLTAAIIYWQKNFIEKYIAQPIEKLIYKIIRH
ncbi:MAG: hypothetical protein CEN89_752 [Candidatus Berkelbacteria bacterium Licking1014_7]|uniref:Phosphatidic acid phosphatase type 2/haloperoxidase domain-containing protein n=1 Tax=Candidatus Berkelbacteria bacterium Licking1014_7 TaxID=2017147 RepID=A0A554LHK8_9BACT|nr:MAG: hypothetical protein CEN89_752 [Candidatus Berkelbacteria bacterium Licking1014_7]